MTWNSSLSHQSRQSSAFRQALRTAWVTDAIQRGLVGEGVLLEVTQCEECVSPRKPVEELGMFLGMITYSWPLCFVTPRIFTASISRALVSGPG